MENLAESVAGRAAVIPFLGRSWAETGLAFLACPVDAAFDLEPGVTAVPAWEAWDL